MVEIGEAKFVMMGRKGKLLPDRLAIVVTGRRPTCSIPCAPMISKGNIERAYVDKNKREAERIEMFKPTLAITPKVDFTEQVEAGNFA